MTRLLKFILASAVALFASAAAAQPYDSRDSRGSRLPPAPSQAQLDQILAPIALYPDSLLSQLMIAATYPRDLSEAARWSRANPQLRGDAAVRAVDNEPWDPSVKSLVAFPQVLQMMDERIEWTERLGDAFMAAPEQVADTVQTLRGRADQAGNLRSSDELVVRRDYGAYVLEPAEPEVVYVPYYDPREVYGRWWWPDYQPVWWSPWAGYRWTPGYAGFGWGYGISLGHGFWFSSFDWPRRYIRFHGHRPHYYHGHSRWHGHRWNSDRDHRRNVRHWDRSGDRRWDRDGRGDRRADRNPSRLQDGPTSDARRAPSAPAYSSGSGTPVPQRLNSPVQRSATPGYYADQPAPAASDQRRAPSRVLPAAPVGQSGHPAGRAVERAQPREYVAPSAPAGVISSQPIQAPAARQAPAASPVARERSERSESPQERSESRAERSESRSERSSNRGGGRSRD